MALTLVDTRAQYRADADAPDAVDVRVYRALLHMAINCTTPGCDNYCRPVVYVPGEMAIFECHRCCTRRFVGLGPSPILKAEPFDPARPDDPLAAFQRERFAAQHGTFDTPAAAPAAHDTFRQRAVPSGHAPRPSTSAASSFPAVASEGGVCEPPAALDDDEDGALDDVPRGMARLEAALPWLTLVAVVAIGLALIAAAVYVGGALWS